MITAMVRQKLFDTPAVSSLVYGRIFVDSLPCPAVLPAISVHPVSRIPSKQVSKGWNTRVQVSCWSDPNGSANHSPAEVETVAAAVIAALHMPIMNNQVERWTIGAVSFDIVTRMVTGGTRVIEDPTGWYHVPVDVQISYREV